MFGDEDNNDQERANGFVDELQKLIGGGKRVDYYGEEFEPISYKPENFREFGKLLVDVLFGKHVKDDTPPEMRERLMDEILAMAFMRGLYDLIEDTNQIGGDLARVVEAYHNRASGMVQSTANGVYEKVDEAEDGYEALDADEKKLHDYLKEVGVRRMGPSKKEGVAEHLRKLAKTLGVDTDRIDEIIAAKESGEPTPGCDCERCRGIRAERGGDDGDEDAPAPTAVL